MEASIAPHSAAKPRARRLIGSVSAAEAYQDFVVGSRSWPRLLAQELIGEWLSPLPGAVGLLARRQLWRFLFEECGQGTVFGRNVAVRHALKMRLGANVMIDDDCLLDAGGADAGSFRIDDGVLISRSTRVVVHRGELSLGPRVNIGVGCSIFVDGGIRVGADTMFAAHCYIGGGKYDVDQPIDLPMSQREIPGSVPTVIEEGCWIGAGAIVLSGVTVGRGSVIGAGALVTRDIPPYSVAVGQPARVTRMRRHAPRRSLQVLPGR